MGRHRQGQWLTKTLVEGLPEPPGGAESFVVWDAQVGGLGLRRYRGGKRSWLFRYRHRGRQRFYTIGEYGQPHGVDGARKEAHRLQAVVTAGGDPASKREQLRVIPTLEAVAERWIRDYAEAHKAAASVDQDKLMLARLQVAYVDRERGEVGDLGRTRVDGVTREQVAALHRRMQDTPTQANRALALLSAIFTWAGRVAADNPCRGARRYREERRERFLSLAELARLGAALYHVERLNARVGGRRRKKGQYVPQAYTGESPLMVGAIRLLIFTGARPSEILRARRSDVDFEACHLRVKLPKEKRPKLIRLGAAAMEVIRELPRRAGSPWLLPGYRKGQPLVNLHDAWARIRAHAELEDVRLYDLRHSYASVLASGMRESLPVIGALLGHRRPETTARYVHLAEDPLRGVADAADQAIAAALKGNKLAKV